MFDFVRDHTRLALGFMLLLIIPSFIFFGVQGYSRFTDASGTAVAKVDGRSITRVEWDDAQKRAIDQMRSQQPNIDVAQFETPALRRETLDGLVRERTLLAAADQLQLFPPVNRMARLFDSEPQFAGLRGADGKINRELLAMQGMTPQLFDQRLRQELGVKQVLGGITQSAPVASAAASAALDAFFQRREVQIERFDTTGYRAKVSPTDAELEAYYKSNEAQFKAPEQATIDYAVLDLDTIGKGLTISEADVRKAYDENLAKYTDPEERRASHILIKADKDMPAAARDQAKAKAETLLAEVTKSPAQFAELARKNSEDPGSAANGGDLDFIARGAMVKPFEDAVFALKKGEISRLVTTEYGYHVIMLTDLRGGASKPFDAVKGEVEAELRKSLAQKRWAETAELFTNTSYEQSDSLQPAIDKLKLQKQTATVTRMPQAGAKGALASTKFLDAVFANDSVRNKRNTDAIEIGGNMLAAAHVTQYQPAHTQAYAEVKEAVRQRVVEVQAAALAHKDGEARLAALRAGTAAEALPTTLTISRVATQGLPRNVIDALMQADASKLPAPLGVDLGGQGYVVARIVKVLQREPPPGGEQPLREQVAQAWAAAEADAYLGALKKRYKVEIKPAASIATEPAASAAR